MKIYGDTNSGNCLKVKWVCDNLALPYSWIAIDTLKGETRTAEFLKLNGAGQVPTVEFDDGRTLAQSNAIIRYLARDSDSFRRRLHGSQDGRMAVLGTVQPRALYRGMPLPDVLSGQARLRSRSRQGQARLCGAGADGAPARHTPFLVGDAISLADVSLLAYTRLAHEGGFDLDGYAAVRRWIGDDREIARPAAGALTSLEIFMSAISEVTIRRARREDVGLIIAMLADDPLGGAA